MFTVVYLSIMRVGWVCVRSPDTNGKFHYFLGGKPSLSRLLCNNAYSVLLISNDWCEMSNASSKPNLSKTSQVTPFHFSWTLICCHKEITKTLKCLVQKIIKNTGLKDIKNVSQELPSRCSVLWEVCQLSPETRKNK